MQVVTSITKSELEEEIKAEYMKGKGPVRVPFGYVYHFVNLLFFSRTPSVGETKGMTKREMFKAMKNDGFVFEKSGSTTLLVLHDI